MHEKGLQRQMAVGTLPNSQQRIALAVPQLNRWSTAGQPLVNRLFRSSTGLHRISFFSCLRGDVQSSCLWYPGGLEGRLPPRLTEMSALWFAQLRSAPPSAVRCADPTGPLCVRVLDSTGRYTTCPGNIWGVMKSSVFLANFLSALDPGGTRPAATICAPTFFNCCLFVFCRTTRISSQVV